MKLFLIEEKKKKCCELKRKIMRTSFMCEDQPREREYEGPHNMMVLIKLFLLYLLSVM